MSTKTLFGTELKSKLLDGIQKLNASVSSTLGPGGRTVLIQKEDGTISTTKDGVSVARSFHKLDDDIENIGAQLVKQVSVKSANEAGDGTTTSTLLATVMIEEGMKLIQKGTNVVEVKKQMEGAIEYVREALQLRAQPVTTDDQIKYVATISGNNDEEIGSLLSEAIKEVGYDGIVTIESSKTGETTLDIVEGMQFERGYKSPYFVTDNNTMSSVLDNPAILILDTRLNTVKELLPILEAVSAQGKSLLIIAEDIDNEALATLIVNKMRGTINVCAVKAPDFGDRRKLILEDIAITTGGQVFSKEKGMKLDKFNWEWFGSARKATITKDQTTIVDGKGNTERITARIEELQNQLDKSTTPYETEQLQNRLAKFVGGVAIIHVGGNTETEMLEKKDRVDDALHATKAAIAEGILPGGGVALLVASQGLDLSKKGHSIVAKACAKPFEQILLNAGYDTAQTAILGKYKVLESGNNWNGVDVESGEIVDFKERGIIDPTKVTRLALENAASIAGTILLTECTITQDKSAEERMKLLQSNASQGAGMMDY